MLQLQQPTKMAIVCSLYFIQSVLFDLLALYLLTTLVASSFLSLSAGTLILTVADFELWTTVQHSLIEATLFAPLIHGAKFITPCYALSCLHFKPYLRKAKLFEPLIHGANVFVPIEN
jgi:hypothetical protein